MTFASIFLSADRRLRPGWRALLFLPAFGVLLYVFASVTAIFVGHRRLQDDFEWMLWVSGVASLLAALVAAQLLLRFADRRGFRSLGLWFYAGWLRDCLFGLAGGLLLISLVIAGEWGLGAISFVAAVAGGSLLLGSAAWNLFLLLPAAAAEELVFRGYPFQRLVQSWGQWPALLFFSASFAALHLKNPHPTPISTANTALMGILLALAYLKSRGLWLPIGLHFAWNYGLGFLCSLPVSGLRLEKVFWRVEVVGPVWLTGGAYGPEGSLVCSVVALAGIVVFLRWGWFKVCPALSAALE